MENDLDGDISALRSRMFPDDHNGYDTSTHSLATRSITETYSDDGSFASAASRLDSNADDFSSDAGKDSTERSATLDGASTSNYDDILDKMDRDLLVEKTEDDDTTNRNQTSKQRPSLKIDTKSDSGGSLKSPLTPILDNEVDTASLQRFRLWAIGIVLLDFDLDVGQTIEYSYPPGLGLDETEKSNIRFSSFPDSSSSTGDTLFSFRCPSSSWTRSVSSEATGLSYSSDEYLYGYVFFRQTKDSTYRRGYMQKSLVILSIHPYPGLFLRLAALMGRSYFELHEYLRNSDLNQSSRTSEQPLASDARQILTNAFYQIASWPQIEQGKTLELVFDHTGLIVEIPAALGCRSQLLESSGLVLKSLPTSIPRSPISLAPSFDSKELQLLRREQILASIPSSILHTCGFLTHSEHEDSLYFKRESLMNFPNTDYPGSSLGCFLRFADSFDSLWTLWELMVLGEPLVVFGRSQVIVSETIWWLTELIKPLPFGGDFRPYFTIQDMDFSRLTKLFAGKSRLKISYGHNLSSSLFKSPMSSASSIGDSDMKLVSGISIYKNDHSRSLSSSSLKLGDSFRKNVESPQGTAFENEVSHENKFILLGVTNPFFIKALEDWPHKFCVSNGSLFSQLPSFFGNSTASPSPSSTNEKSDSPKAARPSIRKKASSMHLSPGLTSHHKPYLIKDKTFIQTLDHIITQAVGHEQFKGTQEATKTSDPRKSFKSFISTISSSMSPSNGSSPKHNIGASAKPHKGYVLNEIIRRHFVQLTEQFLNPLNRYFASLIPSPSLPFLKENLTAKQRSVHSQTGVEFCYPPSLHAFKIRPFNYAAFLQQLSSNENPKISFKSTAKISEFYARFLESPNFHSWLKDKKLVAERQLRKVYISHLLGHKCGEDENGDDLELLYFYLCIRRELFWLRGKTLPFERSSISKQNQNRSISPRETVLLIADNEAAIFEDKAIQIWKRFKPELQKSFSDGLWDSFLDAQEPLTIEGDILVVK